jgi:hypothetical protein
VKPDLERIIRDEAHSYEKDIGPGAFARYSERLAQAAFDAGCRSMLSPLGCKHDGVLFVGCAACAGFKEGREAGRREERESAKDLLEVSDRMCRAAEEVLCPSDTADLDLKMDPALLGVGARETLRDAIRGYRDLRALEGK